MFREFPRVGPGHLRIGLVCVGKTLGVYQIPTGVGAACLKMRGLFLLHRITVVLQLKLRAVHCFLVLLSPWNSACCGPTHTVIFETVTLRPDDRSAIAIFRITLPVTSHFRRPRLRCLVTKTNFQRFPPLCRTGQTGEHESIPLLANFDSPRVRIRISKYRSPCSRR